MTDVAVEVPTERVSMVWPGDLKGKVREKVGARGLTEFVIAAVEQRLSEGPETQNLTQEINKLRWLVQQLADLVAVGGDFQHRLDGLMELELPSWLDVKGWPIGMAERVSPEKEIECKSHPRSLYPVSGTCPECEKEKAADPSVPVAPPVEPEPKKVEAPKEPAGPADDKLAKVLAMAKAKGVELADISLKPASEIPVPEKKPDPQPEPEALDEERFPADGELPGLIRIGERVFPDVEPVEDPNADETEQLRAEAASAAGLCAKCGEELIDGECWTCE